VRANFQALDPLMQGPGGTPFPLLAVVGGIEAPSYSFAEVPSVGITVLETAPNRGLIFSTESPSHFYMFGDPTPQVRFAGWAGDWGGYATERLFELIADDSVLSLLSPSSRIVFQPNYVWSGASPGSPFSVTVGTTAIGMGLELADTTAPALAPKLGVGGNAGAYFPVLSTAPLRPPAGYVALYAKSNKQYYQMDDAGLEIPLVSVFNNPMTGLGDLIRGGAGGDPTRLAPGSNGQFLSLVGGLPTWAPVPPSFSNPMTALGDVITGGASGVAGRLGIGSANQVLTVIAGVPAWAAPSMVNPMTTAADLIVGGASGTPTRLGVGANTQVLTVVAGALAWQAPVSGGMTNPMSALGDLITGGASGVANRLAIGSASQVLTVVGGVPTWQAPVSGGMTNPMSSPGDLIIGAAAGSPIRLAASTNGFVLTLTAGSPAWAANAAMGNPMTAVGDLIRGGAAGAPTRLAVGANGTWLTLAAGVPAWASLPVDPGFANPMSTLGDVITGGAAGAPGRLGIGTTGQILTVAGGVPTWAANAAMANPMTGVGDVILGGTAGAPTRLAAVAAGQVFASAGVTTAPVWTATPTLSGLTLATTNPGLSINKAASGQASGISGQLGGVLRWQLLLGDTGAETGSNAGSNLTINAYTDAGAYMSSPFGITRATGDVVMNASLRLQGSGPQVFLNKSASGQQALINGQTAGVARWGIALGDSGAESGGNAGSNCSFYANSDTGAFLSTPLALMRADVTNPVQILAGGLYRQLTLGATDSGGAGFRMVRVPN
jgi:hypothetical protein